MQRPRAARHDLDRDLPVAAHAEDRPGLRRLDYDPQRPETLDGLPINHSATHVDFMIGGPDVTVTGVRSDGSRRVILAGEH
jgi:hypothetical protein